MTTNEEDVIMNTRIDSLNVNLPSKPDLQPPDDQPLPHATSREEMNKLASRLLPGAVVTIETRDGKSRSLTVENTGVPEWTGRGIGTSEEGKILSGYGTTYLLVGRTAKRGKYRPEISWPSRAPFSDYLSAITVEKPADAQIQAEKTAADLLWRVSRHNGQ